MNIEFRWCVRIKDGLPPDFNSLSPAASERVLQFRSLVEIYKNVTGSYEQWSEWQDIPTIDIRPEIVRRAVTAPTV